MAVNVDEVECAVYVPFVLFVFFASGPLSLYASLSCSFLQILLARLILFIRQFSIKIWHRKYKYSLFLKI